MGQPVPVSVEVCGAPLRGEEGVAVAVEPAPGTVQRLFHGGGLSPHAESLHEAPRRLVVGEAVGGHPAQLPEPLRDAFVSSAASLNAEAAEIIEDHYFRPVGETELGNASLQGMARELRKRHDDRFTEYFSPEALESFNQAIEGHFSGIGLSVVPVD